MECQLNFFWCIHPNFKQHLMNRINIILWLVSLCPLSLLAQAKSTLQAGVSTGYYNNVFRAPDIFVNGEGDTLFSEDIQGSSWFTEATIDWAYRYKWNKQQLGLDLSGTGQIFPTQSDLNLYVLDLEQSYSKSLSKKWSLYQAFSYKANQRSGADNNQELVAAPLAYQQAYGMAGLKRKFSKAFYTKFEIEALRKTYQPGETSSLRYTALAGRLYGRYKWLAADQVEYTEASLKYQRRSYLRESYPSEEAFEFDEELFEEDLFDETLFSESAFRMQYLTGSLATKIIATEAFYFKPFIDATRRQGDRATLQYFQYRPGISLKFSQRTSAFYFKGSYASRSYKSLVPAGSSEQVQYKYLRLSTYWEQAIKKDLFLKLSVAHVQRFSNFDIASSRQFRPYDSSWVKLGLRWKP